MKFCFYVPGDLTADGGCQLISFSQKVGLVLIQAWMFSLEAKAPDLEPYSRVQTDGDYRRLLSKEENIQFWKETL